MKKLLQQALDALEHVYYTDDSNKRDQYASIEELRAAIAKPNPLMFTGCVFRGDPPAGFSDWDAWAAKLPMRGVSIECTKHLQIAQPESDKQKLLDALIETAEKLQKRLLNRSVQPESEAVAYVPLTDKQVRDALTADGVKTMWMTQAITRRELWLTEGSVGVMKFARAIERAVRGEPKPLVWAGYDEKDDLK